MYLSSTKITYKNNRYVLGFNRLDIARKICINKHSLIDITNEREIKYDISMADFKIQNTILSTTTDLQPFIKQRDIGILLCTNIREENVDYFNIDGLIIKPDTYSIFDIIPNIKCPP